MTMIQEFETAKYKGRWAVFAKTSRTYNWIGKGKDFCDEMCKMLNDVVNDRY